MLACLLFIYNCSLIFFYLKRITQLDDDDDDELNFSLFGYLNRLSVCLANLYLFELYTSSDRLNSTRLGQRLDKRASLSNYQISFLAAPPTAALSPEESSLAGSSGIFTYRGRSRSCRCCCCCYYCRWRNGESEFTCTHLLTARQEQAGGRC